jgi:predicted amidohydrolase YtcJ
MRNHLIIPKFLMMTLLFLTEACGTGAEAISDAPAGADAAATAIATPAEADDAGASAGLMTGSADAVFVNGVVLTMDTEQPEAQAVAVKGNRILAVGSKAEIEALKDGQTRVIDLGGKTLMPGFIDTHAHIFDRLGESYDEAQEISLQNGITTTSEFYVNQDIYDRLVDFETNGTLKMRVALYLSYNSSCGEVVGDWYKQYPVSRDAEDKLRVTGIKIYGDGGDCNIPAYSFDFPGLGTGDLYFEKDELAQIFKDIDASGYQIAIHTLGDRSLDVVLDAYDTLIAGGENPMRHRVEHNAVVRPDQMDRFGSNQLVVSVLGGYPVCRRTDPVNPLKFIIPDEYASWEWPYRQMMDASPKAVFAWQSDSPLFGLQFISSISQL